MKKYFALVMVVACVIVTFSDVFAADDEQKSNPPTEENTTAEALKRIDEMKKMPLSDGVGEKLDGLGMQIGFGSDPDQVQSAVKETNDFYEALTKVPNTPKDTTTANDNKSDTQSGSKPQRVGIAMVPYSDSDTTPDKFIGQADLNHQAEKEKRADSVEKKLFRYAGQQDEVDRIYAPRTIQDMWQTLAKQKEMGKKVDFLIIAGHASKETPGARLGDVLTPEDVDLEAPKKDLVDKMNKFEIWKNKGDLEEAEKFFRLAQKDQEKIKTITDNMEMLHDVMAPNAEIRLVSCSVAASDEGKRYIANLGKLLLNNGGKIIASKQDISIGDGQPLLDPALRQLRNIQKGGDSSGSSDVPTERGDTWVSGDWETFSIAAKVEDSPEEKNLNEEVSSTVNRMNEAAENTKKFLEVFPKYLQELGDTQTPEDREDFLKFINGITKMQIKQGALFQKDLDKLNGMIKDTIAKHPIKEENARENEKEEIAEPPVSPNALYDNRFWQLSENADIKVLEIRSQQSQYRQSILLGYKPTPEDAAHQAFLGRMNSFFQGIDASFKNNYQKQFEDLQRRIASSPDDRALQLQRQILVAKWIAEQDLAMVHASPEIKQYVNPWNAKEGSDGYFTAQIVLANNVAVVAQKELQFISSYAGNKQDPEYILNRELIQAQGKAQVRPLQEEADLAGEPAEHDFEAAVMEAEKPRSYYKSGTLETYTPGPDDANVLQAKGALQAYRARTKKEEDAEIKRESHLNIVVAEKQNTLAQYQAQKTKDSEENQRILKVLQAAEKLNIWEKENPEVAGIVEKWQQEITKTINEAMEAVFKNPSNKEALSKLAKASTDRAIGVPNERFKNNQQYIASYQEGWQFSALKDDAENTLKNYRTQKTEEKWKAEAKKIEVEQNNFNSCCNPNVTKVECKPKSSDNTSESNSLAEQFASSVDSNTTKVTSDQNSNSALSGIKDIDLAKGPKKEPEKAQPMQEPQQGAKEKVEQQKKAVQEVSKDSKPSGQVAVKPSLDAGPSILGDAPRPTGSVQANSIDLSSPKPIETKKVLPEGIKPKDQLKIVTQDLGHDTVEAPIGVAANSKLEKLAKKQMAITGEHINEEKYTDGEYAGQVKSYITGMEDPNHDGNVLRVKHEIMEYGKDKDGKLVETGYREVMTDSSGEEVMTVDRGGIKRDASGQATDYHEVVTVKDKETKEMVRTYAVVENGKETAKATTPLDKDGNEKSFDAKGAKDKLALEALRDINKASQAGPQSASPGSMKKIAQKKFVEGMQKLAQEFVKIDNSVRNTMAEHEKMSEKMIEQAQQNKNVWAGGQTQDGSRERQKSQDERVRAKTD